MPDNGRPSASDRTELSGEFLALDGEQARVRLSTGEIGILADAADAGALEPGQPALFHVERRNGSQTPVLSIVRREDPAPAPAFDQEVNRLHDALANHHPTNSIRQPRQDLIGEDQIQQWVKSVEQRLATLRKNRAKRLDAEL